MTGKVGQITLTFGRVECKVHYDGAVVSVGLLDHKNEKIFTLGVGVGGTFEFIARLGTEHIILLWGDLAINGQPLEVGGNLTVPEGGTVQMRSLEGFAYFCRFERREGGK